MEPMRSCRRTPVPVADLLVPLEPGPASAAARVPVGRLRRGRAAAARPPACRSGCTPRRANRCGSGRVSWPATGSGSTTPSCATWSASTSTSSTGGRRTSRSWATRGTPSTGSTSDARPAGCGSPTRARCWPPAAGRTCCSRATFPLPRSTCRVEDVAVELLPGHAPHDLRLQGPRHPLRRRRWTVTGRLPEAIAWSYEDPLDDARDVRGLVSFYQERLDLELDGEPVPGSEPPGRTEERVRAPVIRWYP